MLTLLSQYRLPLIGLAISALMTMGAAAAWQWQANAYGQQISDIKRQHTEAQARAQAQARSEEQRRQTALEGIREHAQIEIAQAGADAATADATADGLRIELDRLKRSAARNPSLAAGGAAGPDTIAVLADLLSEVESAGRAMAAEADSRGIKRRVCERAYDSLRP